MHKKNLNKILSKSFDKTKYSILRQTFLFFLTYSLFSSMPWAIGVSLRYPEETETKSDEELEVIEPSPSQSLERMR